MFAQSHRTDDERHWHTYRLHMFNSEDSGDGITTISEDAEKAVDHSGHTNTY